MCMCMYMYNMYMSLLSTLENNPHVTIQTAFEFIRHSIMVSSSTVSRMAAHSASTSSRVLYT